VHIGHLQVAVEVQAALRLDVVLLVVAAAPWQKVGTRTITPAADRLAVVAAACEELTGIEPSAVEIARGGPTYTADTLVQLRDENPGASLFLILGADVASQLGTWERPGDVRSMATVVAVARPGSPPAPVERLRAEGWRVDEVAVPGLDVSSTDLRRRVAEGRPIDVLVPARAVREIRERGLYARLG
jgi:nicotinate-nucleotide adenylyltransferase